MLAVLVVLVLAGCGGSPPPPEETVTPAPVPDATPAAPGDVAVEDGRVDARRLGAVHAATLEAGYSRVVELGVTAGEGRYLTYRETLTLEGSNASTRSRVYEGPGTPRFVPDLGSATEARSERYAAGEVRAQRRTVDGRTTRAYGAGGAPPLESPLPALADGPLVAALLEGSTVVGRSANGGVRLRGEDVRPAVVPDYLEDPRNVTVRATVRADGRVTAVEVRYLATLHGESVAVVLDVRWSPPAEVVEEPEWVGG